MSKESPALQIFHRTSKLRQCTENEIKVVNIDSVIADVISRVRDSISFTLSDVCEAIKGRFTMQNVQKKLLDEVDKTLQAQVAIQVYDGEQVSHSSCIHFRSLESEDYPVLFSKSRDQILSTIMLSMMNSIKEDSSE